MTFYLRLKRKIFYCTYTARYVCGTIVNLFLTFVQRVFGATHLYADGSNVTCYYIMYVLINILFALLTVGYVDIDRFITYKKYNNAVYGIYKNKTTYYYYVKNITYRELFNKLRSNTIESEVYRVNGGTIDEVKYSGKNITHVITHLQNSDGLTIRDVTSALTTSDQPSLIVTYEVLVMDYIVDIEKITKTYDISCNITDITNYVH